MWNSKLAEARRKAAQLAADMQGKYREAENATDEGAKASAYAAAKEFALKLTEANQDKVRIEEEQAAYDADMRLARDYTEANPSGAIATQRFEAEPSNEARDRVIAGAHQDAAIAYLRGGGDTAAAKSVLQARGVSGDEIALRVARAAGLHGKLPQNTMIAGDLTRGGILIPPEWLQLQDDRAQPPVMRSMCEVVTTASESVVVPLLSGELETPNMTAEGYEHPVADRQDITLGGVEIKVNDWHPTPIVVSQKLLRSQGTNIDAIIGGRIGRRRDLDQDLQFLFGDGAGEAHGLMREGGPIVNSESASGLTWAGMLNLVFDDINGLGEEWSNGTKILMRRATFAAVLSTPDPNGNYVFRTSEAIAPNTILGEPVVFSPHMKTIADAIAAPTVDFPMIRGWFPAYTIVDHVAGTTMKRLEEKYDPNIGFSVLDLFGGRCVQTSAFVKLKIAV